VARLGQYLKKQTGSSFSEDQLGRLLHQEGFSFQRPKHTLRGKREEVAYAKVHQALHAMKKSPGLGG
jgi:transposase